MVGIIPTILINWVALFSYKNNILNQELDNIQNQCTPLVEALEKADYFSTDSKIENPREIKNCITLLQSLYNKRIILIKGTNVLYDSTEKKSSDVITNKIKGTLKDTLSEKDDELFLKAYDKKECVTLKEEQVLKVVIPLYKEGLSFEETGFIYVVADTKDIFSNYQKTQEMLITISCILIAFILVITLFYSGFVVKPLKELIQYIERITDGFLGEKVSMKSYAEVEDVVDSINHMTTKLETLESSRQEFVSNVSHELKTPITSIKVLADSLLQQEDAPAELYREFLTDITDEIERENKIITDLLSLVKLDKTSGELNIETIKINELLEQILRRIKPIAAKRNIELVFESYRSVLAEVDEVKLSLAVNNLIENAVKYNFDNGWVRVSLNADHKFFYIKVSDSGVGIPEDEQENVFERFYRVDKARSRETGGTGLGLSITRNAILMHRGAIKVYSKEKEGTTFTVRIPLNHVRKNEN